MPSFLAKAVSATIAEQSGEALSDEAALEPIVTLTKKRRKLKVFLICFAVFLVVAATALMIAGYFTPFYVNQSLPAGTYNGITISQDVTAAGDLRLTNMPFDLFMLAKYREALLVVLPGLAPMYTGVDLAIAGFSLFIVAIPVIIASAFVKGQLAAAPAQVVPAEQD